MHEIFKDKNVVALILSLGFLGVWVLTLYFYFHVAAFIAFVVGGFTIGAGCFSLAKFIVGKYLK